MNILIVVKNLSGGGAEKVATDLSNYFSQKHNVTVLTLSKNSRDNFDLNSNINRISIDLHKKSQNIIEGVISNFSRILKLRSTILKNRPDVVISFMNRTNIRVLMSMFGSSIPVIVTEHNYPKLNPMSRYWELLRKIYYKRAYRLISVSMGVSDCFSYLPDNKKMVIYNPIELNFNSKQTKVLDMTKRNIVAMGRLVEVKGFDQLIESFSLLAKDFPDWNLTILGDGESYSSLRESIVKLDLEERVFLPGFVRNPHSIIKEADIFALSSKNEGFSLVIIEAMRCGVPVISTDCPVGPREIIVDKNNGLLIPIDDTEAYARGLRELMESESFRDTLKKGADQLLGRFSNEKIFSQWDELLEEV